MRISSWCGYQINACLDIKNRAGINNFPSVIYRAGPPADGMIVVKPEPTHIKEEVSSHDEDIAEEQQLEEKEELGIDEEEEEDRQLVMDDRRAGAAWSADTSRGASSTASAESLGSAHISRYLHFLTHNTLSLLRIRIHHLVGSGSRS
jgi:hypothetical protein